MKFLLLLFLISLAFPNPFLQSNTLVEQKKPNYSQNEFLLNIKTNIVQFSSLTQRHLRQKITNASRNIKKEFSLKNLVLIIAIIFLYGFFHAIGPGHGKIIATSYFLGTNSSIGKGLLFGFSFSILHSMSALLFFIVTILFLKTIPRFGATAYEIFIQKISFYLIAILGIYLVIKGLKSLRSHSKNNCNYSHLTPIALGIVPCPGTLLFLSFFTSINMLWLGILSVLIIALGMTTALSLISILVILFKEKIINILDKNDKYKVANYLTIFGGILLITLGVLLTN
jgi:nickel/cobalt transporter (NicO) family protein